MFYSKCLRYENQYRNAERERFLFIEKPKSETFDMKYD